VASLARALWAVDDPCELPPTGGYRGLENQLYRVQIHDPGQPGAGATFKWSRENASVGSRVASIISASELELQSLGRDDVLRFKNDDWVEITDDVREFSQKPGEIRRITVPRETRRIQFTSALPGEMLPTAFPDSTRPAKVNMRVRLWNQSRKIFRTDPSGTPVEVQDLDAAMSTGVINVPAAGTTPNNARARAEHRSLMAGLPMQMWFSMERYHEDADCRFHPRHPVWLAGVGPAGERRSAHGRGAGESHSRMQSQG
jgi:uncharacterized protein DUF6519